MTYEPTQLEGCDYGTSGWNAIYSSNFQKLNDYLAKFEDLWNSTPDNWNILRYDSSTSKWIKDTIANLSTQLESYLAKVDLSNVDDNTILTKLKNVDGSGSGLDSDTVDGHHADISPTPLTIPVANSSGYINDWIKQGSGSGLDADLLDGKHASDFVPVSSDSDISISISGTQVFNISTAGILTFPKQSCCVVYLSTDQSISANTWTKVALDTTEIDTQNEFDSTNNRITVNETGKYLITGKIRFIPGAAGDFLINAIYINGAEKFSTVLQAAEADTHDLIISKILNLNASDYIELYAKNLNNSSTLRGGYGATFLSVIKIT
ncbi:MAG: hypothetical protein DRP34_00240 [Thermodesulfobacteriota bacterium]|nr:MAG: hypothetical protein DRP34_00240 [Thermodesulfobacteriota bacterium]